MKKLVGLLLVVAVVVIVGAWLASGVNQIPALQETAKAQWSQVENQYQRRADLIPNLIETVKGYAQQEREVLTAVVEARSKATSVRVDASILNDPGAFKTFQETQQQLSGALGRLLAVSERYPDLKSSQSFLALQSQLEGTENRIAVARRDYIEAVRAYNIQLRTIPGRWFAAAFYPDAQVLPTFEAAPGKDAVPQVNFK